MSKLRCVNTKYWDDTYIISLDPIEKLLFLYFLTNPLTNICGIYEISLRRIAFDTGIDSEMINKILKRFSRDKKIHYVDGWICIINFQKHQIMNISIQKGIENSLAKIPKNVLDKVKRLNELNEKQTTRSQRVTVGTPKEKTVENTRSQLTLNQKIKKPNIPNDKDSSRNNSTQSVTVGGVFKYKYKYKDIKEVNKSIKNIGLNYNKFINSKSRLTDGAKVKIKTRLVIYLEAELIEAIRNFSDDKWWMDNNSHRGMAWFFHNDDRIDKLLTLKPINKNDDTDSLMYE